MRLAVHKVCGHVSRQVATAIDGRYLVRVLCIVDIFQRSQSLCCRLCLISCTPMSVVALRAINMHGDGSRRRTVEVVTAEDVTLDHAACCIGSQLFVQFHSGIANGSSNSGDGISS